MKLNRNIIITAVAATVRSFKFFVFLDNRRKNVKRKHQNSKKRTNLPNQ